MSNCKDHHLKYLQQHGSVQTSAVFLYLHIGGDEAHVETVTVVANDVGFHTSTGVMVGAGPIGGVLISVGSFITLEDDRMVLNKVPTTVVDTPIDVESVVLVATGRIQVNCPLRECWSIFGSG
ncbi:hypothetical protein B0O99DRAFT_590529 [Bisporella sp. PMI_857]|nr:hypothetical protein B0O99DRAFT_590529 [Bisporella sp. PMI_857]